MSDYDSPMHFPTPSSDMEMWLRTGRMREWFVESKATPDQPLETRFAEFMSAAMSCLSTSTLTSSNGAAQRICR